EPLTVARHVVGRPKREALFVSFFEEPTRLPRRERRSRGHVYCHHGVATPVEELSTVPGPDGLVAAFGGDRHRFTCARKTTGVDFVAARLRRNIGDPATVGRKCRSTFAESRLDKGRRLSSLITIEDPDTLHSTPLHGNERQHAMRGPGEGEGDPITSEEAFLLGAAVQRLRVNFRGPGPVRCVHELFPVRGHTGKSAIAFRREPTPRPAGEIVYPDVVVIASADCDSQPSSEEHTSEPQSHSD